jgi:hypothetical protein
MTFKLLRVLATGTATTVLAGCAFGSSVDRPTAGSINVASYPLGAYRAKSSAEVLPIVHPAHGSASYDPHGALVYVSDVGRASVFVFHQRGRDQQPIGTIANGLVYPGGLTTDRKGALYVPDQGEYNGKWVVQRYPLGGTSPDKTYATDLSQPTDTAVALDGTIYIANFNQLSNGWVAVYPKGDVSKEYRLSDFSGGSPLTVTLDAKQNLYVMYALDNRGSSAVNKYKPGAKTGTNLNLSFRFGAGIHVDSAGNLLVVQQVQPSEILVFPPGKTQPSKAIGIPNGGQPFNFALNRGSKALFAGDVITSVVDRFAYPSGNFQYSIAGGFNNPSAGAATTPSGEF